MPFISVPTSAVAIGAFITVLALALRIIHVIFQVVTQHVASRLAGRNFSSHAAAVRWLGARFGVPASVVNFHIDVSNYARHAGFSLNWPKVPWNLGRFKPGDAETRRLRGMQARIEYFEKHQHVIPQKKKTAVIKAIDSLTESVTESIVTSMSAEIKVIQNKFEARMLGISSDLVELSSRIASCSSLEPPLPEREVRLPQLIPSLPPPAPESLSAFRHLEEVGDQIKPSLVQLKFMALDSSNLGWQKIALAQQDTLAAALHRRHNRKRICKTGANALRAPPEPNNVEVENQKKAIVELKR